MKTFTHACTAAALAAGCMDYRILEVPKDDDTRIEDCAELCAIAIDAGCTRVDCDVDIASDYELARDFLVLHLDGASDGGGGCELVAECPAHSPCTWTYAECLAAAGDLTLCAEQYEFCEREETCAGSLGTCERGAEEQRDWCNENTPDEDCWGDYLAGLDACQCIYDDCLTDETLDCVPTEAAAMIAPPIAIGPSTWSVSRAFLEAQLGRLGALVVETRVWPVASADGSQWRGLRLASIAPGDALHALGLRDGDVIRTIQGKHSLDALAQPDVLALPRAAARVTVGVERGGTLRQHVYHIER